MKIVRISEMLAEMVNTIKSGKVKSWIYRHGFDSNNAYKMLPASEKSYLVISKLFDFSPSLQKSSIAYIDGWIKAIREDADFLLDKTLQEDIKNAANIIISHINAQCNKPILPKLI